MSYTLEESFFREELFGKNKEKVPLTKISYLFNGPPLWNYSILLLIQFMRLQVCILMYFTKLSSHTHTFHFVFLSVCFLESMFYDLFLADIRKTTTNIHLLLTKLHWDTTLIITTMWSYKFYLAFKKNVCKDRKCAALVKDTKYKSTQHKILAQTVSGAFNKRYNADRFTVKLFGRQAYPFSAQVSYDRHWLTFSGYPQATFIVVCFFV